MPLATHSLTNGRSHIANWSFQVKLKRSRKLQYRSSPNFQGGIHVGVDVPPDIGFPTGQRTLPWQPILAAKSAEIGNTSSFLELAFHNGWQDGKADGCVNSTEVMSTSYKNLLNFGPLTLEFTVMVWRPCAKCAKSSKRVRLLRLALDNGRNRWTDLRQIHTEDMFGPLLGWVWMSRSKVKVTRAKTHCALATPLCCGRNGPYSLYVFYLLNYYQIRGNPCMESRDVFICAKNSQTSMKLPQHL